MARRSRLGLDLNFFRAMIQQPDPDVVKGEVFLNFARDLPQHMYRVVTRNGHPGNIVEKCQLARAALLVREQPRIFHRHRYLSRRRDQHVQIALFEDVFFIGIHGDHDSRGPVP